MPKNEPPTTMLALRPGKRELGFAVFDGKDLIDWGVMNFREGHAEILFDQLAHRLTALVTRYQPTVMAMEQPSTPRCAASPLLDAITRQIQTVATRVGVRWLAYSPLMVRRRLCGTAQATRAQLAQRLVAHYPHLERQRPCTSAWQRDYWMPMFAAVAVGWVWAQEPAAFSSPPPRGAACTATATASSTRRATAAPV